MLKKLFLMAGDQGGFEQKNTVEDLVSTARGLLPQEEEVLHDIR